jgi:hypothetical protein
MSDLKNHEQMRDDIAAILELSRASWRTDVNTKKSESDQDDGHFPQSLLFKTVTEHPILSGATLLAIGYFGAARFSAMALAGGSLLMRHHLAILPIARQLLSGNLFGADRKP